jgi:UDP-N-acetylglucosamine--N-acetylmuramyl-(pentapeptide) pyrophosphoryl-undecaprenol N-acetylglucosamine transferase
MKRIIIAAGGTGGHFYPGFVTAQALKKKGWEPLMIVRTDDPAIDRLEQENIPALPVALKGLPRNLGPSLVTFSFQLLGSLRELTRAVKAFKPSVALGMGGYLTFPLMYAAWRENIPRALHESNSMLGLANQASSYLGAQTFWGMPPIDPRSSGEVVGTPIRPSLWRRQEARECRRQLGLSEDATTVLIFGGSQGAQALNTTLPRALSTIKNIQVLHISGKGKMESSRTAYEGSGVNVHVREYLEDMSLAYGAADLVICRSGASTLAELAVQRLPALLIPYPHAAANHQDANAKTFERCGAVVRLPENNLSALEPILHSLLRATDAQDKRRVMSEAYRQLELPAADKTLDVLISALERISLP